MKSLLIVAAIIILTLSLVLGLSFFVLKSMKGTKIYNFVKRNIITDEDLEPRQ